MSNQVKRNRVVIMYVRLAIGLNPWMFDIVRAYTEAELEEMESRGIDSHYAQRHRSGVSVVKHSAAPRGFDPLARIKARRTT
jgi:hypothetical protein